MIPKEKTNKVRESDEISSTGDSGGIVKESPLVIIIKKL